MSPFRGSDEILDREIETLEGIARRRLRRYARDLRELDRDLDELKRERARRRARAAPPEPASEAVESTAEP
ncbi:MAG: hypothetical protein QXG65_01035 [Thermoplasmata archaeon]